ncbi:MAG: hypothetical protein H6739_30475 [Alphaproteobacteria bacterium]|nr:hypothetical protein [Alphaproteobacteria bacterium]
MSGTAAQLHSVSPETILPGEREFSEEILDKAVSDLNKIYTVKGLETACMVGQYILNTFFGGDPDAFRGRGRRHVTFRGLAAREDLNLSYSFIWYSVAVVEQMTLLPKDIAEALPLSHHRLLLPIQDTRTKLRLAREARDQSLSKRRFEELIRKTRAKQPKSPRGGRPPLPSFVKGLTRLNKAVELATRDPITEETFAHYTPEDAKKLLSQLYAQMEQLGELAESLRAGIDKVEALLGSGGEDDALRHSREAAK